MADLKALIRKRGGIKHSVTTFKKYLNSLTNDKSEYTNGELSELQERIAKAELVYGEFLQIQSSIEEISDDTEVNDQYIERETFENDYMQIISKAKLVLSDNSDTNSNSVQSIPVTPINPVLHDNIVNNVKLPTIQLPKFSGSFETWSEFKDTFTSIVHQNSVISNVQKLHYLKASLQGQAAQVISSLEITNTNYPVAWKLLRDRYDNKRLLVNNHIKSLFNVNGAKFESASELRRVFDEFSKHLLALESLGQPVSQWDALVVYMISSKFDTQTKREWETSRLKQEWPTIDDIKSFLKGRCELLESLDQNNKRSLNHNKGFKNTGSSFSTSLVLTKGNKPTKCTFCDDNKHFIYTCPEFLKLNTVDRTHHAKVKKLCINCLKKNHYSTDCNASRCKICHKKHNSLLHYETNVKNDISNNDVDKPQDNSSITSNVLANCGITNSRHVMLSTAIIKVKDKHGNFQIGRALLDCGSEGSFLTTEFCDRLGLSRENNKVKVMGINQNISLITQRAELEIQSLQFSYKCKVSCHIINKITENIPSITYEPSHFKIPDNIKLADKYFYKPDKIDVLLGANIFWNLICKDRFQQNNKLPVLQKTLLGWILAGSFSYNSNHNNVLSCNLSKNLEIQEQLKQFWEIEEYSKGKSFTTDEKACEQHFVDTTYKDNGRFVVSIPFKESEFHFGDSLEIALSRFNNLENKFKRNINFKNMYSSFMREYESLGHMTKLTNPVDCLANSFYLPHHGVLKQSSITTKLRVVFDGSSKSSNGLSINDVQHSGPVIQEDLFNILVRFRCHKYVISADVEKMYRQVLINPNQRNLQRIVWRENPSEPISHYTLNTVTYGTTSAPYLAIRALQQVAHDNIRKFPVASKVILEDFYVDDLLTGTTTIGEAINVCRDLGSILSASGFKLRQWISNNNEIKLQLKNVDSDSILYLNDGNCKKTLGLVWDSDADLLKYDVSGINEKSDNTKREMLSSISKLFDPLGLLGPCIITAKIMLQELWTKKIDWDDSLPDELHAKWNQFKTALQHVVHLQIPRFASISDFITLEIHAFSDASERAYGTCIYLRLVSTSKQVAVNLLCAKSRVAPVKRLTIPRLELCGALLASRMVSRVQTSIPMNINTTYYWCDSTILLNWLHMPSANLTTFVANRVSEIQELSNINHWNYINTKSNPADLISRGIAPGKLQNSIWWQGPHWLSLSRDEWPVQQYDKCVENVPEVKQIALALNTKATTQQNTFPFNYTNSLTRLKRIVAWCVRFINNCRHSIKNKKHNLITTEINEAMKRLVKISQHESFANELKTLDNGNGITKGNLLKLSPFRDNEGLLRVGGRLKHSTFHFNKKYPLLISNKHILAKLILEYEHERLLHAGPQLTLASVRDNYWLVGGRNLSRSVIHNCIKCFKANPISANQLMGNLPKHRLESFYAFYVTGVDYAGPFQIKDKVGRGAKTIKCYLCIFICLSTKAVHLEPVTDLTTESFIATFRRFVSRRGLPSHVYSDNGRNFVGAKSELNTLGKFLLKNNESLSDTVSLENVTWHFIPAYSPHQGGLWEAGVKSVKHHIKRTVGKTLVTFEQFLTILNQIECILNSRPLYPLSSSPNDLEPITPSHFLIGRKATSVPDPDVTMQPVNKLGRFQLLQRMIQGFWKAWSTHYIAELQQRTKWAQKRENIAIGTLVLLKEDNTPPLRWELGRISEVHPGSDGVVRVVSVKTSTKVIKRAVTKICPLPIYTDKITE